MATNKLPENSIFFREYYEWGKTPTYLTPDNKLLYCVNGLFLTWQELKANLLKNWQPSTQEGEDIYMHIKNGIFDDLERHR
jgi:hypothetical protein